MNAAQGGRPGEDLEFAPQALHDSACWLRAIATFAQGAAFVVVYCAVASVWFAAAASREQSPEEVLIWLPWGILGVLLGALVAWLGLALREFRDWARRAMFIVLALIPPIRFVRTIWWDGLHALPPGMASVGAIVPLLMVLQSPVARCLCAMHPARRWSRGGPPTATDVGLACVVLLGCAGFGGFLGFMVGFTSVWAIESH